MSTKVKFIYTGSPLSPGSPGLPFRVIVTSGASTLTHFKEHPSEQHLELGPSHSESCKQLSAKSGGGHSALSGNTTIGHSPGFGSPKIKVIF